MQTDGDVILLNGCWVANVDTTHDSDRRIVQSMDFVLSGVLSTELATHFSQNLVLVCLILCLTHFFSHLPFVQHPYVYAVLIFEAMATFIGQVSVLSLIALFGAATTAMVLPFPRLFLLPSLSSF